MAEQNPHEEDAAMLDPNEAEEIVEDDGDAAMDSGDEDDGQGEVQQTIQLQNDSVAHFDGHKDSVYCIAQHPLRPELVATGGGDDTAYLWDATPEPGPVLPVSYETNPQPKERKSQEIVARLGPQDETVNAIAFTLPRGEFIVTGTAAGTLNVFKTPTSQSSEAKLIASAKEVDDITWILPCPSSNEQYANTIALGAADGSVWVYTIEGQSLNMVQSFFLHQTPCTAGAWTPGGQLLATVDEASSLFVWDVFGEAAAAGVTNPNGSQALIQLTAEDERFKVDGGLYSAAISPGGGIVAVGGAFGNVRVVSLPRLSAQQQTTVGTKGAGAKAKAGGAKQAPAATSTGNFGQILAAFAAQTDGIETLDFSQPPLTLLAAGSVDGSIAIFDAAKNFSVRRHIKDAHALDEVPHAVIKVEFTKTPLGTANPRGHFLTSCGNDGVVRRWDVRGGTAASADKGLLKEWKGHIENDGERGGILGFVQGNGSSESGVAGKYVVTAGDDGVSLVFDWKE